MSRDVECSSVDISQRSVSESAAWGRVGPCALCRVHVATDAKMPPCQESLCGVRPSPAVLPHKATPGRAQRHRLSTFSVSCKVQWLRQRSQTPMACMLGVGTCRICLSSLRAATIDELALALGVVHVGNGAQQRHARRHLKKKQKAKRVR